MKNPARTILAATAATLLPLLFSPSARAQTSAIWNSTSGNWSDITRWSTNPFFPNNGNPLGVSYDAVINAGGVNLDMPITIENLFLNGGAFSSASNQTLTLNQKFRWTGGTVAGGTIAASGGLVIAGTGGHTMGGGTLINAGAGGVWESSGGITLAPGASGFLINNAGATFDIQGGGSSISRDQSNPAGATLVFTNNGLLKKTLSTGDFSLGFGVSLNNNAQTVVDTGRLILSGGGTSAAGSSFSVASGARILFNGDVYSLGGGTALQGAGVFELAGGTLNLAGNVTAPVGQGHLEITGTGGFGGGVLTGTGTLAVETIRWLGGPARVNGGTSTARTGLVIAGTDGRIMGGGTLINVGSGGVWESSGGITLQTGPSFLVNDAGGTFDIRGGGGSIHRDQFHAGATLLFTNNGVLKKTVSTGDFVLGFGASLNNNAQTVVETGRLILGGGGTSTAGSSFTVASGARILFNGNTYSLAGGTVLQGAGVFELAGGTLNLAGNVTAPVGQGHLEITGAGGFGGGILTGTGSLAVETIRWIGGPATVAGGISTARTGLVISGPDGHRMEGGTLINAGANGVWESTGQINLRGPSEMKNAAGATFDLQGGTGGGFFREFPYAGSLIFTNDGLLKKTVSAGNFYFGPSGEVTVRNSGTTDVQTGTLHIPVIEFNRGTLRASTGGILKLGGASLDNRGGLIETLAASTIQVNDNSTIIGGAFNNVGGTFDFGNNVTLDGRLDAYLGTPGQNISLSGIFPISSGRSVTWKGGINNSGVVSLDSSTSPATLTISGMVDLMGGGKITLGGSVGSSLIQADLSGGANRLNSAQLIEGAGTVSVFLDNNALVQANVAGRELHLSGDGENIGHTMLANGGNLRLSGVFENAGGIVQTDWSSSELRLGSSTIRGGTIRNTGGTITVAGNRVEGHVTPVTLEGEYKLAQGLTSTFKGTILNNGLVRFENATSASTLRIEGSVSLNGSGSLSLEGPLSRIDPSLNVNADKILNSLRIRGLGTIAVKIDNLAGGVLDADIAGGTLIFSQTLTNTGWLGASNNTTLTLSGGGSSTQPILAGPTSVLNFSGSTFTLDGGANLTGAGNARITAGLLAIGNDAGDIVTAGKLALVGGDLGGAGRLDVATALDWSLGNILGTGPVNLLAGSNSAWTGADNALSARVLNNAGFIGWNKSSVSGGNGAILNNAIGGNISFQGDHQFVQSAGGAVFNNAGIFGKGVGAATATIGTQFNNTGFVHAQSGTLYFSGGGTQSGEFRASGLLSEIAFNGSHLIKAGASFTGNGITRTSGGITTFGESAADQFALTNFHVNGGDVSGPGTLFISNSMNWNSGFIGGSGAVELLAGSSSIWNPASGTAWSGRTLNNSGAITQQNYFFLNNAAQFNNFGSYSVQGDHAIYGDAGSVFSNFGTLTKTAGAGTASFELPFHNSGLVESQSGRFNMNTGGTHTGVFKMSSGATVSFNGAHLIKSGAGFQGAGTVLIGSGTTTFGEAAADAYSLANLKVTGGDVAGPATLNIAESLNWSGATIGGSGVINLAAGSASVWNGSSSILNGRTLHNYGTTTLSRDLTVGADAVIHNVGSFELQGAPTVFVGAGGGTFINTGTFTKTGTGTATVTTVFQNANAGLVQVDSGALRLTGGGAHQGDFIVNGTSTVLRLASGYNQVDGSTITGTGAVELIGGNLRVASGGAIIESRLRLQTNSVVTGPGQLDVSSLTWTDGTMSDTGKTLVVPGGTMTISGGSTKNIEKRTLENQGALTWSGDGILRAQDGGRLVNFGTMTITGNGTFDGLPGSPNPGAFINALGGTVTKTNATGVTIFDTEFVNNGTATFSGFTAPAGFAGGVAAAPSQSVQLKKGSSGSGNWFYDNVIVEWFLGLFGGGNQQLNNGSQATVQVASGQNFQVNASLTLGSASSMVASGGGNIVASGGGNIVAGGGGNIVAGGGGNLVANDGGTLIGNDGGTLIGHNGSAIAAGQGDSVIPSKGSALAVAAPPPGSIIAANGGKIVGNTGSLFVGDMYALSGGSLLPGDAGVAGIMSVNGNVTLDAGSKLKLDIRGLSQGTGYDLLDVNTFEAMAGSVIFNGDLLLSMIYGVRTSATALTQFTILTTDAPITGTIGNLVAGRVTTTDGFGSFAVSFADAGSDLVLSDFTATPLTYALWSTAFAFAPGGELFTADTDRDGLINGLEYGLGSDPLVPDADAAPRVSLTEAVVGSGVRYLTLTYERPVGVNRPTDLAWNVQRNTNLGNPAGWSDTGLAAEQVTPQPGTGLEMVVVRSQTAISTAGFGKEFLRLSVEKF